MLLSARPLLLLQSAIFVVRELVQVVGAGLPANTLRIGDNGYSRASSLLQHDEYVCVLGVVSPRQAREPCSVRYADIPYVLMAPSQFYNQRCLSSIHVFFVRTAHATGLMC